MAVATEKDIQASKGPPDSTVVPFIVFASSAVCRSGAAPIVVVPGPLHRANYTLITHPQQTAQALLASASAGKSLDRSAAMDSFVARAVQNRGRKPRNLDAWAERLAGDTAKLTD